ncbi:MAG: hypothetical protein ACOYMN_20355 [Roseimicrobium sp.]
MTHSIAPRGVTMPAEEWRAREEAHRARVAPFAEGFLERRAKGEKHPVWDFLFTYYSFSPGKLMTWVPGVARNETWLMGEDGMPWVCPPLPERLRREAAWVAQLCTNMLRKPARFVCHGLHEWAMVYKQSAEQVRHNGYELRLAPQPLAEFVESQTICCTHYDAFRFYTPEARPLNTLQPTLETRLEMEQSGCLHANMDLYKWAYKLWPWIGSDLVAETFEVAVAGRELDMRASPYDLATLGFAPICIETEEGRATYRAAQRHVAQLAEPVRERLLAAAEALAAVRGV